MYETKVILVAMSKIIRKADSLKEAYEALEEMANAEGVILKPFNEENEKTKSEKK